jgi:5-hydroxyisourate hydrolase
MAGKLTTHVLDIAQGRPADHMAIELWLFDPISAQKTLLKTTNTNSDGRTDIPLLVDEELKVGVYELVFAVGEYFAQHLDNLPNPPFLARVPIQFGIADPTAHYHVPLLTSPWSYSTYRGS